MRLLLFIAALLALLPFPTITAAQDGVALVRRAIAAHGGTAAMEAAGGVTLEGKGTLDLSAMQQGRRHDAPEIVPITQRIVVNLRDETTSHRYDWYNYAFSNQRLFERYDENGRVLFADLTNGGVFWPPFLAPKGNAERYRRYLPGLLLAEAAERGLRAVPGGPFDFHGRTVDAAWFETAQGERLQLYFESATGMLAGLAAPIDAEMLGQTTVEFAWSDYARDSGWAKPGRLQSWLGGRLLRDLALSISAGVGEDLPGGLELPDPPESQIAAEDMPVPAWGEGRAREVADNIWLFPSIRPGFHPMAIEFADHVVAIDAPAGWYELEQIPPHQIGRAQDGEALTRKFIRAIHAAIPGKPIRYAVMTHHHSDHVGGFRAFAEEGVELLASEEVAAAIRMAHANDPGAAAPKFTIVDGEHRLADPEMTLRLIELPPDNPKAAGMLVAYAEPARLLYATGFIYPIPEEAFPLQESVALSKWYVNWLDQSGLELDHHYNVHGQARVQDWQVERVRAMDATPAGG